jgi:hypothetical protein
MLPSWFMRVLLHYYKVELHHLAPNSVSQAAIFVAVCEGYLGMEPPLESVASPLQGGALRQEGGRAGSAACGARWELHPSSPGGSRRALHLGVAHLGEQRMARRVVLPTQRRRPPVEVLRLGPDVA